VIYGVYRNQKTVQSRDFSELQNRFLTVFGSAGFPFSLDLKIINFSLKTTQTMLNGLGNCSLNFLIKLKLWCMRVFQASSVIEILIHV
jgi:hypothetical protein